jgi:hypothetical protein
MLLAPQPPGVFLLYPFRFVDPVHERWEIIGTPEIRMPDTANRGDHEPEESKRENARFCGLKLARQGKPESPGN